jgi:two-component sensor histidine kinase/PAS domain-containing protein
MRSFRRASDARLANALQAAAVWDWDRASGEFIASDRFCDIYGFGKGTSLTFEAFLDATHPDDRQLFSAMCSDENVTDSVLEFSYRIHRADNNEVRWIATQVSPGTGIADGRLCLESLTGVVQDETDLRKSKAAFQKSEERLKLALEAGKLAIWEVDLWSRMPTSSPELNLLFGFSEDADPTFDDYRACYAPGELERLAREGAALEVVLQDTERGLYQPRDEGSLGVGGDRTQIQTEVAIITPAGEQKTLLLRAQYTLRGGHHPHVTGSILDITERKLAEEKLATVARELHHRVKNSLTVVQAIANQSFKGSQDKTHFQAFAGRLRALSSATDLILDRSDSAASLIELIATLTKPYRSVDRDPFVIEGPEVQLRSKAVTPVSMVLHELCTNAVKYGALTVPAGLVRLSWHRPDEKQFQLLWMEEGGPPATAPAHNGFGTRLLKMVVAAELGGSIQMDYGEAGFQCRIVCSNASVLSPGE